MKNIEPANFPDQSRERVDAGKRRTAFDSALSVRLVNVAAAVEECARLILSDSHFIGLTELRIMSYLSERPQASVSEIGRDLQVDKAWISRLLKQLETRHLLRRARSPGDTRQLVISLTEDGRAFLAEVMSRVQPYGDAIADGIDETLVGPIMDRIEQNVRALNTGLRAGSTAEPSSPRAIRRAT